MHDFPFIAAECYLLSVHVDVPVAEENPVAC